MSGPSPPLPTSLALRPLTDGDRFRLRRWLTDPDVIAWWGSRAAAEATIQTAAQSASAIARIIDRDGDAIGYAQAIDLGDPQLPADVWQADVFLGAARDRQQGLGSAALALLRDEVFATTLAAGLAVRMSIKNERAVRAIERVGFRWRAVISDATLGPCWLLVATRQG